MKNKSFSYDLNIFTNCTLEIETYKTIKETYKSFCSCFGIKPVTIWLDPNPLNNKETLKSYIKYIQKNISPLVNIKITKSLSDGYIQAAHNSTSNFSFMLEHDFIFNNENIKYTLNEIFSEMEKSKIHHLRFNIRNNWEEYKYFSNIGLWDAKEEIQGEYITYCTTLKASNNPHIINNPLYKRDLLKYLKVEKGSFGIEHNLPTSPNYSYAILGGKYTPCTLKTHLDGRRSYYGERNHLFPNTSLMK